MTEARHHNGLVDKKANGLSSSLQHATHWSPTALSYCYFPPPKLKSDTAVVFFWFIIFNRILFVKSFDLIYALPQKKV